MKISVSMAALLLSVSAPFAADRIEPNDGLSKFEAKSLIQSEFPKISDEMFEELYTTHGSYERIWSSLSRPVDTNPMEMVRQQMEGLSIEKNMVSLNQEIAKAERIFASLDQQEEKLASEIRKLREEMSKIASFFKSKDHQINLLTIELQPPFESILCFDFQSQVRNAELQIESYHSYLAINLESIKNHEAHQQEWQENVQKAKSKIEEINGKIKNLEEENAKLASTNEALHQETLQNIRTGKYFNSHLDLKRQHNNEKVQRNRDEIYRLRDNVRSEQETVNTYTNLASESEESIKKLIIKNKKYIEEIYQSEDLLLSLKKQLSVVKREEELKKKEKADQIEKCKLLKENAHQKYIQLKEKYQKLLKELEPIAAQRAEASNVLEGLIRQKKQIIEARKGDAFNLLKQQFQSLNQFDFNKLYELETGDHDQAVKNITETLKIQEAEEKERQERLRLDRERAEEEKRQEEQRQSNLAQELRVLLLNGKTVNDVIPCMNQLKSLTWVWNNDNSTLLHFAVEGGDPAVVAHLLKWQGQGINVNANLKNGESVLHRAAFLGHTTIAQHLLTAGANVFHKTSADGVSILEAALNHLEGCIEQEKWGHLDNAHALIKLIMKAMEQHDQSEGGDEGASFPSQPQVMILINRVSNKIDTSKLESQHREAEAKRLREYQQQLQMMIFQHLQMVAKKKEEEKKRQEEQRRQQQSYHYQPQYAYRY